MPEATELPVTGTAVILAVEGNVIRTVDVEEGDVIAVPKGGSVRFYPATP